MAVTVRPITSAKDRKRFIDFPYTFYKDQKFWIPPLRMDVAKTLNPKKNPFFEHGAIELFLAEDSSGNVVGRIAAIKNGMHLKKYNDANGFFGFFECKEDYAIAEALLNAAADWLRKQGLSGMRGPTNPSMNDTSGLLVDGFDRYPALLMPYNMPYYFEYLKQYGFDRAMTMWAYYVHKKYVKTDKLRRGVSLVKRRNPKLTVRTLDMRRFDEEARTIMHIYNEAWSNNWGHVPMTDHEFAHLAADLKQIVEPRIIFFVEDEGKPVAFSVSLPDMNQALRYVPGGKLLPLGLPQLLIRSKFGGIHEIRMPLMGVLPKYHGRGLDALLILATIDDAPDIGYQACEMSWVLDSNKVLVNSLNSLGGVIDKEYAMLEMSL